MSGTIILQFSTSKEWSSMVIRRMTHSPFSHVDVAMDGGLFGASDPGGVMWRRIDYQVFGIRQNLVLHTPAADLFHILLKAERGKPFDGSALWSFMSEEVRDWRRPDKWFCSELVFQAFKEALVDLLARTEGWEVSPQILARTPLASDL